MIIWRYYFFYSYSYHIFRICFTWEEILFWGATVITSLLLAIPYLGKIIVEWIWGVFSIANAILTRFYRFHFILSFIVIIIVIIHLIYLHKSGSLNPLGRILNIDKIPFNPIFVMKDLLGITIRILLLQ